jgi:hypothetical protein
MYPGVGEQLELGHLAAYWADELARESSEQRQRHEDDIRNSLECAWWLGELPGDDDVARLKYLKVLFARCGDEIQFVCRGRPVTPQTQPTSDGGLVLVRRIRVTVPNQRPATWTVAACGQAFSELAGNWFFMGKLGDVEATQAYNLVEPLVRAVVLSRDDVLRWAKKQQFSFPGFWAEPSGNRRRPISAAVLKAWYLKRVKTFEATQVFPSVNTDWQAAVVEFGADRVTRDRVREMRSANAPAAWKQSGRRRKKLRNIKKINLAAKK